MSLLNRVEKLEQARPTETQDARRWRETFDRVRVIYGGEVGPAAVPSEAEFLETVARVYAEG